MTRYAIKQPNLRLRHGSPGIIKPAEQPKEREPLAEGPPTGAEITVRQG